MSIFAGINFGRERFRNYLKGNIMMVSLIGVELYACYAIGNHFNYPQYGVYAGLLLGFVVLPVQILLAKRTILKRVFAHQLEEFEKHDRKIIQLAEQLAEQAGLAHAPKIYRIISPCPNSFAVGLSSKSAVICLTKGLLDEFDEEEVKAVISHEIVHILQGDIFLNQLIIGLICPLFVLASLLDLMARQNAELREESTTLGYFIRLSPGAYYDRGVPGLHYVLNWVVIIFILPISILLSNLCHLWISKNREFVADYYGVYLCNNINGMVSALSKLSCARFESRDRQSLGGLQLSSFYINYPKRELVSTHPPIEERVKAVLSIE